MQTTNAQRGFNIELISYKGIDYAARGLTCAAELAFAWRRLNEVKQTGCALMKFNSSPALVGTGAYFAGIGTWNNSRGDAEESIRLLEIATQLAPYPIRARAILALGSIAWYQKNHVAELGFYKDAMKYGGCDAFTFLETTRAIAILQSESGDIKDAIKTLESVGPYLIHVSDSRLITDHHNSLSEIYLHLGKFEEAIRHSRLVASSPFLPAYPEWQGTLERVRTVRRAHDNVAFISEAAWRANQIKLLVDLKRKINRELRAL